LLRVATIGVFPRFYTLQFASQMRHKRDALVGIADGPVHISVGIDEVEGVIADVEQALG